MTSSCAALAVFPVSMLFFDEISVASPLTNILLIPVCSAALVCGLAFALLGGSAAANPCIIAAGVLIRLVTAVSGAVARLRFTYIPLGRDYLPFLAAGAVILVAVFSLIFRRRRAAAAAVCLSLVIYCAAEGIYASSYSDSVRIALLGNAVNSSMVIVSGSHADVVSLRGGGNAASDAAKYLNRMGVYKVDSVLLDDNASSAATRFSAELELFDVGGILVPPDAVFIGAAAPEGVLPEVFEEGGELAVGKSGRLRSDMSGRVMFTLGEFSLLVADSGELITDEDDCNVIIIEKGGTDPPSDCLSAGGYYEIIAHSDGSYKVRGIKNGIGQ